MAEILDFDAALRTKRAAELKAEEPTTRVSMHIRDGLFPLVEECVVALNVQRKVQVVELGIQVMHELVQIAKRGEPGCINLQYGDSTKWKVTIDVDTNPDRKRSLWKELLEHFRLRL